MTAFRAPLTSPEKKLVAFAYGDVKYYVIHNDSAQPFNLQRVTGR